MADAPATTCPTCRKPAHLSKINLGKGPELHCPSCANRLLDAAREVIAEAGFSCPLCNGSGHDCRQCGGTGHLRGFTR